MKKESPLTPFFILNLIIEIKSFIKKEAPLDKNLKRHSIQLCKKTNISIY